MEIGERLLQYRAKHNLTQKQLADLIGVNNTIIHRYEKGMVKPHKIKEIQISEKLNELENEKK